VVESPDPHPDKIASAVLALNRFVVGRGFEGFDPYDALRSPLIRALCGRNKWLRIAFIQAFRRSPLNLRRLFLVTPGVNPKAIGLFLSSYSMLSKHGLDCDPQSSIEKLREMLIASSSPGYAGLCWGYNFSWQNRTFFIPEGTPTIVNSAFCGQALVDLYELQGGADLLAGARSVCDFILGDLNRLEDGSGLCFSYTPVDHSFVHNANILGAALLARVSRHTGEEKLAQVARRCARYLLKHQQGDGSWPYAETRIQQWKDSFHTGFVLDSLQTIVQNAEFEEGLEALNRGLVFFKENFFEPNGDVRYYHNGVHPLDIHCPTQALVTLTRTWQLARESELIERVSNRFLERWQDASGYFYFRISRLGFPVRIPYIRWGQAWALWGLSHLIEHRSRLRQIA